jgi:hypothetical protein
MNESINWVPASDRLPDDEEAVLLFTPTLDEPCWPGYMEYDTWFLVDGSRLERDAVTHWAHMPGGPGAKPIFDGDPVHSDCTVCCGTGKCPDCSGPDFSDRSSLHFIEIHCSTCKDTCECYACQLPHY